MSFTYDPTLATDRDKVRLFIGDTDSTQPLLQDQEIVSLLAMFGSVTIAAATACKNIAAKFARYADRNTGDISVKYSQIAETYRKLAVEIRESFSALSAPMPYVGGISRVNKLARELDTDRVHPAFTVDMDDNVLSGDPTLTNLDLP